MSRPLEDYCRKAVEDIYAGCEEGVHPRELGSLPDHDYALVELLRRQASVTMDLYNDDTGTPAGTEAYADRRALLRQRLEDILSISYSRFYHYPFSDVPLWLRQLYTDTSILKFCEQFLSSVSSRRDVIEEGRRAARELEDGLTLMVKTLDLAIIMAGAAGAKRGRAWVDEALTRLEQDYGERLGVKGGPTSSWGDFPSFPTFEPVSIPVSQPIRRTGHVGHEAFQNYLHRPQHRSTGALPLIISGLVDHWPARTTRPWCKPAYLLSRTLGGRRLVPVEIGRSYVDEGWGQELITFREFISSFCEPTASLPSPPVPKRDLAYLAQHPLLAQVPSLHGDVTVPDLCYTSPPPNPFHKGAPAEEVDEPKLNAWLGPAGTITPLHTDPYHNLLVQVVGRKYVRLYGPWEGRRMRARGREEGIDMSNTSEWDVGVEEGWDERPAQMGEGEGDGSREERTEEFKKISYVDGILEPGDTLYIPVGWWHYVRSLSVSFSVSFWWN